jgi:predicted AAA+ superfamily ATPase
MWIKRDITARLIEDKSSFAQILVGPKQCGKSLLLSFTSGENFKEVVRLKK